ncbi:tetratricopeptide repeat protein [Sorangium sp. So ce861]|uniref:tetratricopeptide repeat protein n=1 Tax=Sorangium sp. So ce861 TaxID=3133323 RepID=UPI003F5F79F4
MSDPVRLFLSAVPKDAALRDELDVCLKPHERSGRIDVWHEGRVGAGEEPALEARARLEAADIVVLLVSPDLLASDRHHHEEAARALARSSAGEVVIVPVPVRHCDWSWTGFGRLKPLPAGGRPVNAWPDRDEPWAEVTRGLLEVADQVARRRAAGGGPRLGAAGLPGVGRCVGRDAEVEALAAAVSRDPPGRVLLLGAAGIGKSTVSRAVLHRPEVVARFGERRFFVELDAAPDAASAAVALADALRVPPGPDLRARALSFLAAGPAVLALDNLETPWDGGDQAGTEAVLAELAAMPQLALVASVRGAGRPGRVAWSAPVELRPLGVADAEEMFCAIAGEEHRGEPTLAELLSLQEGVPLAIDLLASAAQGNALVNLRAEWELSRAAVLERGGGARDRLRSWKASLELSIGSRRMTAEAHRLLAVLAVLPDGIAQRDLAAVLPGAGPAAARVLAQLRLAYFAGGRLKMLSPVREYVSAAYPPPAEDLGRVMEHYGELARTLGPLPGGPGGIEAVARLAPETANLDAMIRRGLAEAAAGRWIDAAAALTRFARFSGHASPLPLGRALEVARRAGDRRREALCTESLAGIALRRSQHADATARYEQALPLYQKVGDLLGEANCIRRLGDIALARSQHADATARYEQALPLYQKVGALLGEANCIKSLGNIALARSRHADAAACYEQALPLYQKVGDLLGEANCIKSLGDIALRRSQHADATARYEQALPLYQKVGDLLGEANCIKSLGNIALRRSQHADATARYEQALSLYQKVGDLLGEANCIKSLGNIALRRSQHADATARYEQALPLYQKLGDLVGEANCIKSLGNIALRRSQHADATARYEQALPLYQKVGAVLGAANCIQSLGNIARAHGDAGAARARYEEALALYQRIPEPCSIGWAHHRLATIAPDSATRRRHVEAARSAWQSIDRTDLVARLDQDFRS